MPITIFVSTLWLEDEIEVTSIVCFPSEFFLQLKEERVEETCKTKGLE